MDLDTISHLSRFQALMSHRRYGDAEQVARAMIGSAPDDDFGYALLSDALQGQERFGEAISAAEEAIRLEPGNAQHHYRRALAQLCAKNHVEGLASIERAIAIDPSDADSHHVRSIALANMSRWAESVEAAEAGLALDPEHTGCRTARASARHSLGFADDAEGDLRQQLSSDPNNDIVHCELAEVLLTKGQNEAAAEHYREALRLDPTYVRARQGLIESLKARNLTYSLLLRFSYWLSTLPKWMVWGGMTALFAGPAIVSRLSGGNPYIKALAGFAMVVFVTLSQLIVCADAIFTLVLRLDRRNAVILSDKQRRISNWQIWSLGAFVLTLATYPWIGRTAFFVGVSLFALLTENLERVLEPPSPASRKRIGRLLALATVVGLLGMYLVTPYGIVHALISAMVLSMKTGINLLWPALGSGLALFVIMFAVMQYIEHLAPKLARQDYLNGHRDPD